MTMVIPHFSKLDYRCMGYLQWRPSWNPIWRPCDVIDDAIIWLDMPKNLGIAAGILFLSVVEQKLLAKMWLRVGGWRPFWNSRWRPPGGVFLVSHYLKLNSMKKSTCVPNLVPLYHFARFSPLGPRLLQEFDMKSCCFEVTSNFLNSPQCTAPICRNLGWKYSEPPFPCPTPTFLLLGCFSSYSKSPP